MGFLEDKAAKVFLLVKKNLNMFGISPVAVIPWPVLCSVSK